MKLEGKTEGRRGVPEGGSRATPRGRRSGRLGPPEVIVVQALPCQAPGYDVPLLLRVFWLSQTSHAAERTLGVEAPCWLVFVFAENCQLEAEIPGVRGAVAAASTPTRGYWFPSGFVRNHGILLNASGLS